MWEHDCGAILVVDADSHVVGMITDRDICMASYTQGRPLWQIPVSSACSRLTRVYSPTPFKPPKSSCARRCPIAFGAWLARLLRRFTQRSRSRDVARRHGSARKLLFSRLEDGP